MFRKLSVFLLVVISAFALVSTASANHTATIVDIAMDDGRFDTLVAAVAAAGLVETLDGEGEYTVFAPTDTAFAKLGLNADNIADEFTAAELRNILLYHVIPGEFHSDKAKTVLGDVTMANGEVAGLKFFNGDLYVNDEVKVIIPDINAYNGVIHAVDTVILGPWPRDAAALEGATGTTADTTGDTIVEIALGDDRFDTLVAAVTAAGLVDTLNGAGQYTVFAPTDTAFAKLGLNANNIANEFSKAELTDILLYHVIAGEFHSDKAKTVLGDVMMANGDVAGLKFFNGDLYVNDDSKVIIPDINASNGVIHAIDTVILGPWPRAGE